MDSYHKKVDINNSNNAENDHNDNNDNNTANNTIIMVINYTKQKLQYFIVYNGCNIISIVAFELDLIIDITVINFIATDHYYYYSCSGYYYFIIGICWFYYYGYGPLIY